MAELIASTLKGSRLFAALSSEEISRLVAISPVQKIDAGKTLFNKGDAAKTVYVVISGEIAIEISSPQGRTVRVATINPGAVFGEFAVLDGGDRTADARAVQDTQLLRIGKTIFRDLIAGSPSFSLAIIVDLISKLRNTDDQVEDISFKPLRSRLASLLLALADNTHLEQPRVQITQSALAERLSATREKVNIHLQSIQRANAIKLRRGAIDILDQDKLAEFIDDG